MVRLEEESCVGCHRGLQGSPPLKFEARIARYDASKSPDNHPEFRPLRPGEKGDPGLIIFNHKLHLSTGLTLTPDGKPFVLAQLAATDRRRYGGVEGKDQQPVKLECNACHQPDAEESRAFTGRRASLPPRSDGKLMLPVTYENHCRACHPLHVDANLPDFEVRHGRQPGEVAAELWALYSTAGVETYPKQLDRHVPSRLLPGLPPWRTFRTVRERVEERFQTAVRVLFQSGERGCTRCHQIEGELPAVADETELDRLSIRNAPIPPIWYAHAAFDHTAHRAISCVDCHVGARESLLSKDLLLPGKSNCVHCHRPSSGASASAGNNCTTCHRYHNGESPLQGLGASARGVSADPDVQKFLREAFGLDKLNKPAAGEPQNREVH
jgi:hypothetical protein